MIEVPQLDKLKQSMGEQVALVTFLSTEMHELAEKLEEAWVVMQTFIDAYEAAKEDMDLLPFLEDALNDARSFLDESRRVDDSGT